MTAGTALVPRQISHAKLGASSAKRWMNCAGSINASRGIPPTTNVYAEEGTALHEVAATCLRNGQDAIEFVDRKVGEFTIDEAMAEAVQVGLDVVRREYDHGADEIFIEQSFSLVDLNPPADMFGTADVAIYKPKLRRLVVIDFKFGQGVIVDATENDQGRYYGVGAALSLKGKPINDVEVVIVQPRAPHRDGTVRRELVPAMALMEWTGTLLERAAATLDPNAKRTPGEWCRFCPASGRCPEQREGAFAVAEVGFDEISGSIQGALPDPAKLTPAEIGKVLDAGHVLVEWYRAACARGFDLLNKGMVVPGWKLVQKRGRRKWYTENEEELKQRLTVEFGVAPDFIYKPKLKSPAQMERFFKSKSDRTEMSDALTTKESSGVTLVRETDSRSPVAGAVDAQFEEIPEALGAPTPFD